jgi:hypothetical protein
MSFAYTGEVQGPGFLVFFQVDIGGVPARNRPVYVETKRECDDEDKPDWVEKELHKAASKPVQNASRGLSDIDRAIKLEFERITEIERKIRKRRCRKAIALLLRYL